MSSDINIGQLLIKDKVITQEQLDHAIAYQSKAGGLIEMILVNQGLLTPQNLAKYRRIIEDREKAAGIKKEPAKKLRLGEILIAANEITQEQLDAALKYQQEKGVKIGIAFLDLGFIQRTTLVRFLTKQSQMVIDSANLMNYEATDMVSEAEKK
ncbi:MAG: hypothetical protein OEV66_02480 [Spirochaetia bacterium]|nr:hypothetical protein [Spirochaetia bacterium]